MQNHITVLSNTVLQHRWLCLGCALSAFGRGDGGSFRRLNDLWKQSKHHLIREVLSELLGIPQALISTQILVAKSDNDLRKATVRNLVRF